MLVVLADAETIHEWQKPLTAPQQVTKEKYRPELDGIRAFCIIFTVLNHVPGMPFWVNGTVGVDVFFALSGWLITSLLIREHQETGAINLPSFYIRRTFRILPLYFCTVILYSALFLAGAKATGMQEFSDTFGYMISMCMEYRPKEIGNLFGHAWTLGIEEKFYIGWPLILFFLIRHPGIAAAIALLAVSTIIATFGASDVIFRGYIGLALGAGLAMLAFSREAIVRVLRTRNLAGISLFWMAAAYVGSLFVPGTIVWNLLIAAGAALGIASLWFNSHQIIAEILSWGPLPWLGRLTYAIYLVQQLCIRAATAIVHKLHLPENILIVFVASYGLSIAAAWVAHIAVEKPMIRIGKGLSRRFSGSRATLAV